MTTRVTNSITEYGNTVTVVTDNKMAAKPTTHCRMESQRATMTEEEGSIMPSHWSVMNGTLREHTAHKPLSTTASPTLDVVHAGNTSPVMVSAVAHALTTPPAGRGGRGGKGKRGAWRERDGVRFSVASRPS